MKLHFVKDWIKKFKDDPDRMAGEGVPVGNVYELNGYYKIIRVRKRYPWPCVEDPDRTILLTDKDILTKNPNGTYTSHVGFCSTNIEIPDGDVVYIDAPTTLQIL